MLLNRLIWLLVISLGLSSCRKVITLELRESEQKYVIEGVITNEPGTCSVLISKTRPFYEDNQFEGVSGATVKVTDNGAVFVLAEKQAGYYETNLLQGVPGHQYELSVTINNEVYTASCKMPLPVEMDTLYIAPGPFGQFKFATVSYTDPAGINNGYRLVQYVNGRKEPKIFWEDDEFTDGQPVTVQLDNGVDQKDDPGAISSGDEVTVELLTLDEPVLKFWYSMGSGGGAGDSNTAAPANPLTNIIGGALGYFSAHTIDRRTIIAP